MGRPSRPLRRCCFGLPKSMPILTSRAGQAVVVDQPGSPSGSAPRCGRLGHPITDVPIAASARIDTPRLKARDLWIYALVAPFPTVVDGVTFRELLSNWKGTPAGPFAGRTLLMDESTAWRRSRPCGERHRMGAVRSVPADQLLEVAWGERPSWAIVPFESLDPRWKVLAVDGQSPVRKDFELSGHYLMQTSFDYPLAVPFRRVLCRSVSVAALPDRLTPANRDPSKMTTVIMTGVTASCGRPPYHERQRHYVSGTRHP